MPSIGKNVFMFFFRRITFCLFFISMFLYGFSQPTAKFANTLLWEISGNGLSKPSYLFGTMHVSNKIAFHLRDSFFTAISSVDNVATELNPDTWLSDMVNSDMFKTLSNFNNQNLSLNGDFYNQFVACKAPNSNMLKSALLDNSQLVNTLMYRMAEGNMSRNYEEGTYLDMYIYQTGKKLNKATTGLENFDQTIEMLMKAMMPDEDPKKSGAAKSDYDFGDHASILERVEKAYRRADLNELDSLMRLTYLSKNYEKYLILDRNKIMADRMDSIMKTSGPLFTGVGAAHLPGKSGIIRLLEAKGYKVRPVLGPESSVGKKMRDKIENKLFSHQLSKHALADSILEYSLPGKLINIPTNSENELLLYPDIANGAYYVVYRLKHYARVFGRTERFIAQQVDSVLYETVPGKILMKKNITSNAGYPGMALSSKLPNGQIMQFHVYYTPIEMIICKAGGSEQASKSSEWNDFFASLKFDDKIRTNAWSPLNQPNLGFSVQLPSQRAVFIGDEDTKDVRVQAFDSSDSTYYFVLSNNLNDYNYLEDDTFELNYLADQFASKINAKILSRKLSNNSRSFDAIIESSINQKKIKTRLIIQGSRYYALNAVGKDTTIGKLFFGSFRVQDPSATSKSFALVDSTMFFKTSTDHAGAGKKGDMIDLMRKMNLPSYMMNNPEFSGLSKDRSKEYSSEKYPVSIQVNRRQLHEYYYQPNVDSLWKDQMTEAYARFDNYISKKSVKAIHNDSVPSVSYLRMDSLSHRALWIKKVLKNDHLYTLTTIVDTTAGPTPWQQNFYRDFTPWDTCKGLNVFEHKGKKFISDLYSKDSASFERATQSFYVHDVIGNDTATDHAIVRFINTPRFKTLSVENKKVVINYLSYVKEKHECFPLLERLYNEALDTSDIQFAVLNVLADYKDTKSTSLIVRLLENNLPLSGNEENISGFFYSLADSLELARLLMPTMLKYLQYPEYKSSVLELFARLVVANKLAPADWAPYKNTMMREAQVELKRYNSEIASKVKPDDDDDYISSGQNMTSTVPWLDSNSSSTLACYATGFSQIYQTDAQAKQLVDKIKATGHKGLVYTCALVAQKYKQPVSDTIWNWLAGDKESRMYFCDWLEVTKDTSLYPKKYYNQLDMSYSWLMAVSKQEKKDSLQFLRKVLVSNARGKGYLYFFKYKDKTKWKLNYVGFQPVDSTVMLSDFSYHDYKGIKLNDQHKQTLDDAINKACKKVRLTGRKRVKDNDNDSYNYDYTEESF